MRPTMGGICQKKKKKLRKVKIAGGKGKGREEMLASESIGMDEPVLGTGAKRG